MASVSCRSLAAGSGGSSGCGGRLVSVLPQVLLHAQAGAGIPIGATSHNGAAQPAAIVTVHVACHVEGARPSFTHDSPLDGPLQMRPMDTLRPKMSWRLRSRFR